MKNLFLAFIIIGFAIIGFVSLNKLNHIKIYEASNGEKIEATLKKIEKKEDIKEISDLLKSSKITEKKRDLAKPQYIIKTSSSEYYIWIDGEVVVFADKKHQSVFYEDNQGLLKYIK